MKLITTGDIIDEVLASLERSGLGSASELSKYEADPAYFAEQMKGAFDLMKGLFNNPEYLKTASEAKKEMQDDMSNPLFPKMKELLFADNVSEVEIEELQLLFLQNPNWMQDYPSITMGLSEKAKDAKPFKAGFFEARKAITEKIRGMGMNVPVGGAGVGEL
jgi:hypothetical protein